METAICTGCLKDKPLDQFEWYDGERRKRCRVCVAARRRAAYKRNPQPSRDRENAKYDKVKRQRNHQKVRANKRLALVLTQVRHRSKKHGISYDLDSYYVELHAKLEAGVCELTGIAFDMEGAKTWNSPSLDRIKPELGYTFGNVRFVLWSVNAAMGDWGEAVFAHVAHAYLRQPR